MQGSIKFFQAMALTVKYATNHLSAGVHNMYYI